jgi:hypothetical protein
MVDPATGSAPIALSLHCDAGRCTVSVGGVEAALRGTSARLALVFHLDRENGRGGAVEARTVEWPLTLSDAVQRFEHGPERPLRYRFEGTQLAMRYRARLSFVQGGSAREIECDCDDPRVLLEPAPLDPASLLAGGRRYRRPANVLLDSGKRRALSTAAIGLTLAALAGLLAVALEAFARGDFAAVQLWRWGLAVVLALSVVAAIALWSAVRVSIDLGSARGFAAMLHEGRAVLAAHWLEAHSRFALAHVIVRLVAYNVEVAPRGRWSRTPAPQPFRAIVLYENEVGHWPQGLPLSRLLRGSIDVPSIARCLLPPCAVADCGVALRVQLQLIHPALPAAAVELPVPRSYKLAWAMASENGEHGVALVHDVA